MSITWERSVSRSPTLYFHDRTEHSKICFGWFSVTSVTGILTIVPQFLYLDVKKGFQKTEQFIFHEGIAHLKAHFGRFECTLWNLFRNFCRFAIAPNQCQRLVKNLQKLTFSRRYRALKNTLWTVWSHISERLMNINSRLMWDASHRLRQKPLQLYFLRRVQSTQNRVLVGLKPHFLEIDEH